MKKIIFGRFFKMAKENKPRWKNLNIWERLARRCKQNGASKKPLNILENMEIRE